MRPDLAKILKSLVGDFCIWQTAESALAIFYVIWQFFIVVGKGPNIDKIN